MKLTFTPLFFMLILILFSCKEQNIEETEMPAKNFDREWKSIQHAETIEKEAKAVRRLMISIAEAKRTTGINYDMAISFIDTDDNLCAFTDLASAENSGHIKTIILEIRSSYPKTIYWKYQHWKPKNVDNALYFLYN